MMSPEQRKINAYMRWLKFQPSLISGKVLESDVAHFSLPIRGIHPDGRLFKVWTGSGHTGIRGLFCLPLEPQFHRIEYPNSFHRIGQDVFLAHHGLEAAEVYALIAANIARFFLEEWE